MNAGSEECMSVSSEMLLLMNAGTEVVWCIKANAEVAQLMNATASAKMFFVHECKHQTGLFHAFVPAPKL